MTKQKRMSVEQYLQIGKWMENNKMKIATQWLAQEQVRVLISQELGYEVPFSSVIRCAKAVGIEWAGSPPKPLPVPLDREAIIILIGALSGIYIETGKTVPDDLANLQSAYAKEGV